jgi:hypothetical protein
MAGVRIAVQIRMSWRARAALFSLLVGLASTACQSQQREPGRVPVVRSVEVSRVQAGALTLPNRATSVKFAVIGDSGRGSPPQHAIAAQMVAFRQDFPYAFVLMLGDNITKGRRRVRTIA